MIVKSLEVRNFRSIRNEVLECEKLTALVGPNGAGKSNFLKALQLFYGHEQFQFPNDIYAREEETDVEIEVTFSELSEQERTQFRAYIANDLLSVVRVFSRNQDRNGKYYGSRLQHPTLRHLREKSGRELISAYSSLRSEDEEFSDLPSARSVDAVERELENWEDSHPDGLERFRDNGQFFGFRGVGQGRLSTYTRFIFVPAVRYAQEDATEGRDSAISMLMDLVVRSTLADQTEIKQLQEETVEKFLTLTDPTNIPSLESLATQLSNTLQTYYRDAGVHLDWDRTGEVQFPSLSADVSVDDEGFRVPFSSTGHGLQRALILTILQHLAAAQYANDNASPSNPESEPPTDKGVDEGPKLNIILGIEEPELYQHPSQQRHFARVLYDLAYGQIPGVAGTTQVLYGTHSALFVSLDRLEQVRRVRKREIEADKPRQTYVTGTTWSALADQLWQTHGQPDPQYTADTTRARVQGIMTPWMNEGFFAEIVVLVEGDEDWAAISGVARARNAQFERAGIAVIPCRGKASLDRPALIFSQLGIQTYLIWDSDKNNPNAEPIENHRLLRLVGEDLEDWPNRVAARYACFEDDLQTTLKSELGNELFDDLLNTARTNFAIPKISQALKNPLVVAQVIAKAEESGQRSQTLEEIVENILALRANV